MKKIKRDYTQLTAMALKCGMIPHTYESGNIMEGYYTLKGFNAPVDLSACAENELSILRTAVRSLSESLQNAKEIMHEKDVLS